MPQIQPIKFVQVGDSTRGDYIMNEYPLFIPPDELIDISRETWNKKQADKYFSWLMESKSGRVNFLLKYLTLDGSTCDQRKLIVGAAQKFQEVFGTGAFNRSGELTNMGYALSADMGLLIAQSLIKSEASVNWTILRKPKSHAAINLPILKGFEKVDVLEPVGGAIAEVQGMLAGRRSSTIFIEMYDYWYKEAQAKNSAG